MKMYLENLIIDNVVNNDELSIKVNTYNKIYSIEGIFTVENTNINRINYIDDSSSKIHYNYIDEYNLICDNTKITKEKVFQIPCKHHFFKYTEYIIKSSPKAIVALVILTSDKCVKDHYFVTNENDANNHSVKEEINKLISYIN